MPPQEPDSWTGIRDASNFSPKCPQKRPEDDVFVGSEDCLYLNVFKPSGARALPVIVFIHGGSNVFGSAGQTAPNLVALYDGSRLAQNGNVVVVTLNYRLGPLGFIGHKKLSEASGYNASGNYAYMDQIQALKWVQRNIAAFGGDPSNVTLFGQSAGAKSVWVHMSSPLSKGLFHCAIVDSALRERARPFDFAEQVGAELSHKLNCSNATDELACMRDKSAKAIVDAMPSAHGSGLYAVVVDGKVLTDSPIDIMQSGHHNHVPILQGNVEEEVSVLNDELSRNIKTQGDYITAVWELARNLPGASAADSAVELLRLYPISEFPSPRQAFNAIFADKDYICSSRRILRALSASQTEFVGRFFYTHAYTDGPLVKYGASHGFELLFIFETLSAAQFSPTPDEAALVKTFQDTWADFARTGTAPLSWKRYDAHTDNYVIFDTAMSESDHLHTKQCDFWDILFAP
jgi:para-nitrobenzyl esterase